MRDYITAPIPYGTSTLPEKRDALRTINISVLKIIDGTKRSTWRYAFSNALLKTDRSDEPADCIGHLVTNTNFMHHQFIKIVKNHQNVILTKLVHG